MRSRLYLREKIHGYSLGLFKSARHQLSCELCMLRIITIKNRLVQKLNSTVAVPLCTSALFTYMYYSALLVTQVRIRSYHFFQFRNTKLFNAYAHSWPHKLQVSFSSPSPSALACYIISVYQYTYMCTCRHTSKKGKKVLRQVSQVLVWLNHACQEMGLSCSMVCRNTYIKDCSTGEA